MSAFVLSLRRRATAVLGSAALLFGGLTTSETAQAQACFSSMPVANPFITSNFGIRKHPKLEGVTRLHAGTDLRAAIGTPIFAVEDGMVTYAGYSASAGNYIIVLGSGGKATRYLHNTRLFVNKGDTVRTGQQIAQSGNTGEASAAPHLHFEVLLNGSQPTDPRPYLCNPAEKPGAGPDPTLNPNAPAPGTAGASPITNGVPNNNYPPMGPVTGAAAAVPQASSLGDYSNMSTHQFLEHESTRRFGNPQWYRDMRDPLDVMRNSPDPRVRAEAENMPPGDLKPMLLREVIFMQNLKNYYAFLNHEREERMQQMLSSDLADRINEYGERVLRTLRSQATQSLSR